MNWLEAQINNLAPHILHFENGTALVHIKLLPTQVTTSFFVYSSHLSFIEFFLQIDGKVLTDITGTGSYAKCYLCGITPKYVNRYNTLRGRYPTKLQFYKYGAKPLHALLCIFRLVLKLGYHSTVKSYKVSKFVFSTPKKAFTNLKSVYVC